MKKSKKFPNSQFKQKDDDQLGDYENIRSDESDSENLLNKYNEESEESSSEEEVLPVFSGSETSSENEISEADDDNEISDSDIEGPDDNLPDPKAWGKQKKSYYNTDRINDKNDFLNEEEEEAAKMEEEEARNIQQRLISELDTADLSVDLLSDVITEKKDEDEVQEKDKIELDLSQMSEAEKLKLLKKECPELLVYMDDYKRLLLCLKDYLLPLGKFSNTNVLDDEITEFVKVYRQLIMNYCTNILFFVLLKARKAETKSHPVAKWITRYKSLLSQMESVYEKKIKSSIEVVLSSDFRVDEIKPMKRKNDTKSKNGKLIKLESETNDNGLEPKIATNTIYDPDEDDHPEKYDQEETDGKRPITREMAKNKGLTPRRKKELRNPRVKHRMKYRKAKIRRRGQVREVRKELQKYGGEISGIKATVIKSIKLKS